MNMKKILLALVALMAMTVTVNAQSVTLNSEGRDTSYVNAIVKRSQKVADALGIAGTEKGNQVVTIVANRYFQLNDIYAERDTAKAQAKRLEGAERRKAEQQAEERKDAHLYRTHGGFLAQLAVILDDAQVDKVKDVMTFDVLHVTYKAQLDMIPNLKDEEKAQIWAWLKEAREYAIDAESSKKKHETFGKYKGRINNYLSKRGYNLTKEREEWAKRVKARGGTL